MSRDSKDCHAVGETFTLKMQTERDGYLTLLDVGTSGNVYKLLENYPLQAGVPTASGPDQSHEWVIGGPQGVEKLKAIVTLDRVVCSRVSALPVR